MAKTDKSDAASPQGALSVSMLHMFADAVSLGRCRRWQLQDAKAQLSELVQRALDGEPQCVTRHGKDAVIVISYDEIISAIGAKQSLFEFFRSSPLAAADIDIERMRGPVRKVDL